MQRILLCVIGVASTFQLSAQHEINFSINSGIGKTALIHSFVDDKNDTRVEDFYSPTFGFNAHYSYSFGDLSLESGLGFNDIKGKHTTGQNVTLIENNSSRTIEKDVLVQRKTRYLTIPLSINYRTEKLRVGIGAYGSYMVYSQHYIAEYAEGEMNAFQSVGGQTSKFDYGLTAQVSYDLSDRASILFSTNYGLKDVSEGKELGAQYHFSQFNPIQRALKNRQFMVGLKFKLHKS